MAEWERETPWRQGHVLSFETAKALSLASAEVVNVTTAIVISHDCDLAQSPTVEPNVDVIVARLVELANGNFTHAKNVRKLHLPFHCDGGVVFMELLATAKYALPKEKLVDDGPRKDLWLGPNELAILQRWLAARYRRAAFADEFDRRLDETGLKDRLTKILNPLGVHIPAIFFDVDEGEEITRYGSDNPYTLDIYLLHVTKPDPAAAEAATIEAKKKIEELFKAKLYIEGNGWHDIELRSCNVLSDEAMSYAQSCILKEWRLEHFSLREDPQQPMMKG